jgi:hypothetical protein
VQKPELQQNEEQENHNRAAGIEKILPVLPETSTAPRDEVNVNRVIALFDSL